MIVNACKSTPLSGLIISPIKQNYRRFKPILTQCHIKPLMKMQDLQVHMIF